METKDWLYTIGIILTFLVGAINLYVTIQNRRNAIREHLYKEQVEIYKEYMNKLIDIIVLYNQIRQSIVRNDNNPQPIISSQQDISIKTIELDIFLGSKTILLPKKIVEQLRVIISESHLLLSHSRLTIELMDSFYNACDGFLNETRKRIGVGKLSEENIKLIGKGKSEND